MIGVAALRAVEHQLCPAGLIWRGILTELLDGDEAEADRLIDEVEAERLIDKVRRQFQTGQEVSQ
ncbi:hypothetical protein [Streptosporangium sp. NPDC001681]|uniref:hypothetical protein n=1 Tax=Streptosporangium sp. NPDC001681 TaxID=3154395 RepID=UPI003325E2F5